MVGGATPPEDGSALIVSLRRMNRLRGIDPHANLALAEAGVILETLHQAVAAEGRRFPLTLGSRGARRSAGRSAEHTSELQSLMRHPYAVFCLQKKNTKRPSNTNTHLHT